MQRRPSKPQNRRPCWSSPAVERQSLLWPPAETIIPPICAAPGTAAARASRAGCSDQDLDGCVRKSRAACAHTHVLGFFMRPPCGERQGSRIKSARASKGVKRDRIGCPPNADMHTALCDKLYGLGEWRLRLSYLLSRLYSSSCLFIFSRSQLTRRPPGPQYQHVHSPPGPAPRRACASTTLYCRLTSAQSSLDSPLASVQCPLSSCSEPYPHKIPVLATQTSAH